MGLYQRQLTVFTGLLVFAMLWRNIGHPFVGWDEQYYFLVASRMHAGDMLYVDIWDRKPFGLFTLYWFLTPLGIVGYQVVSALFAAATGLLITRLSSVWAGFLYIAALSLFGGEGGQAPVFYNLLIAGAALLTLHRRYHWAILLCGIALTIKQTVIFEAVFFGLWAVWQERRARYLLDFAAIGVLPFALGGLVFWLLGHFDAFWQASFLAHFGNPTLPLHLVLHRLSMVALVLIPISVPTVISRPDRFRVLWLASATVGFLAVPNFFMEYALPLLVPLAASAHRFAWVALPFAFAMKPEHEAVPPALSAIEHPFVFTGPVAVYTLSNAPVPTPLAYGGMLTSRRETLGGFNVQNELHRILAEKPNIVTQPLRPHPMKNEASLIAVRRYVTGCPRRDVPTTISGKRVDLIVYYCRSGGG